jgi:hypothetical protein
MPKEFEDVYLVYEADQRGLRPTDITDFNFRGYQSLGDAEGAIVDYSEAQQKQITTMRDIKDFVILKAYRVEVKP